MASTPLELIRLATGYFAERGVESPRLDAEVLLAEVLGTSRIKLYTDFDKPLQAEEVGRYREGVRRRGRREPLAHIVGAREFWSLSLAVDARVLVPRPDTERLVEVALEAVGPEGRLLDLGIGSGAIALALLTELPGWTAVGVDRSSDAVAVARANAETLGLAGRLELREGDWFGPVAGERFDLVVSNPPYIPAADIDGLAPEVSRFDPREALDGGFDGLTALRHLAAEAHAHLAPGGTVAVEFGTGQEAAVRALFEAGPGLAEVEIVADHAGHPRVVRAKAQEPL